jgi:hypothetical protein
MGLNLAKPRQFFFFKPNEFKCVGVALKNTVIIGILSLYPTKQNGMINEKIYIFCR